MANIFLFLSSILVLKEFLIINYELIIIIGFFMVFGFLFTQGKISIIDSFFHYKNNIVSIMENHFIQSLNFLNKEKKKLYKKIFFYV